MTRYFRVVWIVFLAEVFLWNIPQAHAVFGIRAARAVLAARRAEKAMDSSEKKKNAVSQEQDDRSGPVSGEASEAPVFDPKNPDLEKLERSEAGSKIQD